MYEIQKFEIINLIFIYFINFYIEKEGKNRVFFLIKYILMYMYFCDFMYKRLINYCNMDVWIIKCVILDRVLKLYVEKQLVIWQLYF